MKKTAPITRALSCLLVTALAAAFQVGPAAAASSPWVQISGEGTRAQTVSLQELSGQYTGVQVTLELDSAPSGIAFAYPDAGEQTYPAFRLEGNKLTLYVTSKHMLNQENSLGLGTLTADRNFQIVSASGLKLVLVGPNDTETVTYDNVSLSGTSSPGPSSPGTSGPGPSSPGTSNPGTSSPGSPSSGPGTSGSQTSVPNRTEPLPFTDVKETDWFWEAVAYVYDAGLMSGTGSTTFSPDIVTTRGMVVAVLHRYEGSPAAGPSGFQDVSPNQYYAGAVSWAAANGIVSGYGDGLFGPDQPITREQMAAIFYRYAKYKGIDVSGRANLSAYSDAEQISGYAVDAMAWANYTGLIAGIDSHTLQPGGPAARGQVAAILMRFCKNIAGEQSS